MSATHNPLTLIIAPHLDDESISCAGLIQSRVQSGCRVVVLVMHTRVYDYGVQDGWKEEYEDFCAAKQVLGFEATHIGWKLFVEGEPGKVGYYQPLKVIEEALTKYDPTEVVVSGSRDLNQDHQHINHLCQIALRPVNLGRVDRVLEFIALDGRPQEPNFFIRMDRSALDKKRLAVACYKREARETGPRSPVNLTSQHRVWGAMCGHEFAEGYKLTFQR